MEKRKSIYQRSTGPAPSETGRQCRGALILSRVLTAAFLLLAAFYGARAATPATGELSPTSSAPVRWDGTAAGSVNPSPPVFISNSGPLLECREGLNCDTFRLNIGGTEADWTNRIARVRIDWLSPATDYDLYVLRETPYGSFIIGASRHHPADTHDTFEIVDLTPGWNGTGEYAVRVVYAAATLADQYRGTAGVVAVASESPCRLPGRTVLTDPTGDSTDTLPSHDFVSLSVAEPYTSGPAKLAFTMKISDLGSLPPNTTWRAYFRTPHVAGTQYFVDMRTDALGAVSYKYGNEYAGTVGDADAGVYDPLTGAITVTVARDKIGDPQPGQYPEQKLDQMYVRVTFGSLVVDSAPNINVEFSQAAYVPVGNASCNTAPSVSITSPSAGTTFQAGSDVEVEASASDSDGQVSRVDFYLDGNSLGTATSSPYRVTWQSVSPGSHTLTAAATDDAGATTWSAAVNVTVLMPPPAAPSGLTATAVNSSGANKSQVTLRWTDNADNEQTYFVERSLSAGGGFAVIATLGADAVTFTDSAVQSRTTYYYRVRAGNSTGYSGYSNVAGVFVK